MFDPVPEPDYTPVVAPRVFFVQRLGALAEILLCSGLPTQILLLGLLTRAGMTPRTDGGQLAPTFLFTLSLVDTVVVLGLVLFFFRAHRERATDVLFGSARVSRETLLGIVLMPFMYFILLMTLAAIVSLAPWLHNVPRNPLEDMLQTNRDAAMFALVVMIAGGVREEVQRGFILHRFRQYLGGGGVGVIVHSVLFGLGHIEQGYDAAIAISVLGAIWGAVFLARGSIVAPMVSHAGFNLAQLLNHVALR
ncbi:MAG TPA: CPBP family intramembrane glutamic endopeptidase [Vicinamibacterales bacterium]|nr:CPBP family intramembrane glutamic endopeptidase [Vicinamibacterales bacterium]